MGGKSGACANTPSAAPAPIRRLSYSEYSATLSDLVPGTRVARAEFVVDTESGSGFENAIESLSVQDALVAQYRLKALSVGDRVASDLGAFVSCAASVPSCGARFVDAFGERAFRRPLSDAEKTNFTAFFAKEEAAAGFASAVAGTVEAMWISRRSSP